MGSSGWPFAFRMTKTSSRLEPCRDGTQDTRIIEEIDIRVDHHGVTDEGIHGKAAQMAFLASPSCLLLIEM